jgi:methyl-accepting chemotaxis protein
VSARLREIRARQVNARKLRAGIGEALLRLEAQLEANRQRDVRLTEVTDALSEKLGGMVSALQYQDILSQRLQHVRQGLESVAAQSAALKENAGVDALTFLRDAASVESAQLEDVEGVLEGAVESLRNALDGLARETGDLGTECTLLNGVEFPCAAADGMVQVLLDIIRDNVELIQSTAVESGEIRGLLEPIGGLLGNLTGSILELAARIRLIALNAQIQAAQTGDGTGLEVLSSRTRAIAEEMGAVVSEIADELAAMKDGLNSGLEDIERTHARSVELLRVLSENARDREIRLHEFRDRMLNEFRCVWDLVAHVQSESRSLAASLDMRSSVLDVVSSARRELQEFSGQLTFKLGRAPRNSRLERQAEMYTAASERVAHERALHETSFGDASGNLVLSAVEGTVELF